MSEETVTEVIDFEELDEAESIIREVESEDRPPPSDEAEQEFIPRDQAEDSARGFVRAGMRFINWTLRTFKDPRIQYDEDVISQAETEIVPALVKHGVGSSGITKYGEEFQAGAFLVQLGVGTHAAIKDVKKQDAEAEKAKKASQEAAGYGPKSQPQLS